MINKDQVKGNAKAVGGKIEKHAGRLVGNEKLEQKGAAHELAGKVQAHLGNVKETIRNVRKP